MKKWCTQERKDSLLFWGWWAAVLYALFCMAHPYLIGCGCSDVGPEHTCGIVQYLASVGSVGWIFLLPAGMVLFRRRENMLIFLSILALLPLTCSLFWMIAASAGWFAGDLLTMGMAQALLMLVLSVPMLPYVGILPLLGAKADTDTLVRLVFVYALAVSVYSVYRYRHREE